MSVLPPEWETRELGSRCQVQGGFAFKSGDYTKTGDGIPIIKIGDLQNGRVIVGEKSTRVPEKFLETKSLEKFLLRNGDILIAMTGATTGKIGKYNAPASENAYLNQRVGRFLVEEASLAQEFIQFLAQTDIFQQRIQENILAAAQGNISPKKLESIPVVFPPLHEQKKIAHILSTVQQAIEAQERIIQTTTELKKALMNKLFTEGLRNEPQKQTEIGPIPESWEVVELGELLSIAQYGMSVKGNPEGNYPILRMTNQVDGRIVGNKLQFVEIKDSEFGKFKVERGDILFNRTNSLDLVGRTAIHDIEGDYVFASYLIRIRTDEKRLNPFFLNLDFNRDETQVRLKSIATRAVSQSNISATRLKGFPIPLPSVSDQAEIVKAGAGFDSKIELHQTKLVALRDLFRTLLHELMTAKTRVHKLEITA